jgi:predicted secreted protein
MFDGDDEARLREAKDKRPFDPNRYYKLKKEVESKRKNEQLRKERQDARKDLAQQKLKLKQEMARKGIVSADISKTAKQSIDDAKRRESIQKEQGQTENPAQSV